MGFVEPLIGAAAAFLLGFAWYTALFGKAWQAETGVTEEQAQSGMALTHGIAFLAMAVMGFGMNYVINMHAPEEQTFVHGAFHGVFASLLSAIPAVAIHYAYQKKSLKLFAIDAGYIIAFSALMGGVMAMLKLVTSNGTAAM